MISKNKAEINFGGKNRMFYFGLGFLSMLVEETEYEMKTLQAKVEEKPLKMLPILMYYSSKFGALMEDQDVDFNLYKVISWFESDGGIEGDAAISFMKGFGEASNSKLPKDESVKKKEKVRPIKS